MKKQLGLLGALCFLAAGYCFTAPSMATAQDQGAVTSPPKILVINREFVKPASVGSPHERSENALAQAMAQANSPDHYVAMVALTGPTRVLFASGYDSFTDYQKSVQRMQMGNSAEAQAYDRLQGEDGKLLASMDTGVFVNRPEMSVNPSIAIAQMKFMEITAIWVRVGHEADWEQLVKLHNSIYGNMPNAHWAMWQQTFGGNSGSLYIATHGMRSLAEVDEGRAAEKQARDAAGADKLKQMGDLAASTIEKIETNLFAFDPSMSFVGDKWKSADPSFWKQ